MDPCATVFKSCRRTSWFKTLGWQMDKLTNVDEGDLEDLLDLLFFFFADRPLLHCFWYFACKTSLNSLCRKREQRKGESELCENIRKCFTSFPISMIHVSPINQLRTHEAHFHKLKSEPELCGSTALRTQIMPRLAGISPNKNTKLQSRYISVCFIWHVLLINILGVKRHTSH